MLNILPRQSLVVNLPNSSTDSIVGFPHKKCIVTLNNSIQNTKYKYLHKVPE